ncbi:hypothetical protein D3C78_1526020 [compost metagenome]
MQPTVKALQSSPAMLFMALNSTNWISSGTLRKMSSSQARGCVARGRVARSRPKRMPAKVPMSIAQAVSLRVTQAPCMRNCRSLAVKLVENMTGPP